jgi:23S rRNA (pseudouridine1915-N3)-methyltransferase
VRPRFSSLNLKIIAVGRPENKIEKLASEFIQRISNYCAIETVFLKESKRRHLSERQKEEGNSILAKINPQDFLIALDERGTSFGTEQFAKRIEQLLPVYRSFVFVIGSDAGLSPEVLKRAQLVLSLSNFTLAHQIALLVLLEQLYRIFAVLSGHPYHRS